MGIFQTEILRKSKKSRQKLKKKSMKNRADNWKPKTKRQKRCIKETLTDTTLTDYDGEFRCVKTMRTARSWLPSRDKKNLRKEHFSKESFQIDASLKAASANRKATERALANHRAVIHYFEISSKYRGLNQPFVNYRYMLSCPDVVEKVDKFLIRAEANSTKPPIEITYIVDLLQKGRFKPETYQKEVILPEAPRTKSNYLKQVASVEPFTII